MSDFVLGTTHVRLQYVAGSSLVRVVLTEEAGTPLLQIRLMPEEAPDTDSIPLPPITGARRLQLAARLSLSLDTRSAAILASAGEVTRRIRPWSNEALAPIWPGAAPSVPKGFSVPDIVRPILLDRRFDEGLYPFQRSGVAWLLRTKRALLADDMGLGKTLQVLAALRRLVRIGEVQQAVIAAPNTLIENWIKEAGRWTPELTCLALNPRAADRLVGWKSLLRRSHVLVTSYEQLRAFPQELSGQLIDLLILDEAHRVRNIDAQVTRGVKAITSKRTWALTGTPVERDSEDLVALLSLLEPSRFSPEDAKMVSSQLRSRARPYILRRQKEHVLSQLPPVVRREETLSLAPAQRAAYDLAIKEFWSSGERGSFLAIFNRLRTICDIDETSSSSSKVDRVVEIVPEIHQLGEKVVIFSYLLRPLYALADRLRTELAIQPLMLTGSSSLEERKQTIDTFRANADHGVLLASSKVASEGLTLTEANHVIFLNRWWNPSQNRQAEDRVIRIGQQRTVQIYSFECSGTVESAVTRILEKKGITFEELVNELSVTTASNEEELSLLLSAPPAVPS